MPRAPRTPKPSSDDESEPWAINSELARHILSRPNAGSKVKYSGKVDDVVMSCRMLRGFDREVAIYRDKHRARFPTRSDWMQEAAIVFLAICHAAGDEEVTSNSVLTYIEQQEMMAADQQRRDFLENVREQIHSLRDGEQAQRLRALLYKRLQTAGQWEREQLRDYVHDVEAVIKRLT